MGVTPLPYIIDESFIHSEISPEIFNLNLFTHQSRVSWVGFLMTRQVPIKVTTRFLSFSGQEKTTLFLLSTSVMLWQRITNLYIRVQRKKRIFFDNGNTRIIRSDVLTTKKIGAGSIDLLITSPPYNVDIRYNSHNDQLTEEEFMDFSRRWIKRCLIWFSDDGRFCLNIPPDKNKGGQKSVGADLTMIAKKVGSAFIHQLSGTKGIYCG